MSNEITENKVVYNKENCKITTWCKIEGIYLHLKTPAQKLVWMNHVTERDKVFIKDSNILIGVGTDTENVIAYIKGDEYDKAFVSAAIWHHACEEFKNSLVGEGVTPDEDYAVLWVTNEALLIGDNDRYSPIVAPIGAHVAAKQLGVYIPASYQASYRDSLVAAKKYIAHGIKEWVDDPFKDAMSNWYLWGAFAHADMAVESTPATPPLQDAEWYSAYQVARRLSSQYCEYTRELYHELSHRINAGELVEKIREYLNN